MKRATKRAAKLILLENNDLISFETEQLQDRIRGRAYELSQQRGHPGREIDDWLTAESEIVSVPPAELIEKKRAFQVTFGILGINLQDMQVMASTDQVLVKADYRHHREAEDGIVHLCDFKSATLFRSVRFPERIELNSLDVDVQDGFLRITASKASASGINKAVARAKRTSTRKPPAKKRRAS